MNILLEITKALKKYGCKKDVNMQTDFKDLGLDSLDLMNLIVDAEKQFNIRIPDDKLLTIKTVQDLVDVIGASKSGKE